MWRWGLIAFCLLCACREPEDTYRGLRGARFADPSGALMYRFYVPPDASPEHRLPLVLYLGSQRGYDNEQHVDYRVTRWVENQLQHPCFVLAPQLPRGAWVAADPTKGSYTFDEAKLTEPMQLVIELLELFMKRYPLDLTRIYVVGDYGAWELLMRKPHWFAAAIVIEGG
ncbi:MAG TPA: hypothetical protein VFX59_15160, partial [Polyangiales bacterium]|nr:hypothetical protein [Polyangiales bacterium]